MSTLEENIRKSVTLHHGKEGISMQELKVLCIHVNFFKVVISELFEQ